MTKTNSLQVTPTGAALGADVTGIDLSAPPAEAVTTEIADAWHKHLVLRFREQKLSDEAFVRFGKSFGTLDLPYISRAGSPRRPDLPEMAVMSNIQVDGKPVGSLGNAEATWHTDLSYNEVTPSASLLYALEIPEVGGDTYFSNMYAAYDALSLDMKRRIEGMSCKHDATYDSAGELRKGYSEDVNPQTSPGATHPLVRTHPETGRKCLFLGRRKNAYIPGLSLDDSEALLDELWRHATDEAFTWRQQWHVGDLIIWDNRCTLHRRDSFDNSLRRLLHRLQVGGTKPY